MQKLRILIIIAIIANLLTIGLYTHAAEQPGGTGELLGFVLLWMPSIWIITFVLAILLAIIWRKQLFNKTLTLWTILTLLLCTPIPVLSIYKGTHPTPEIMRSSTSVYPANGQVYIVEDWHYTSNRKTYLKKYFCADSAEEKRIGEAAYKRDSFWVYRAPNSDTMKIEKYRRGTIISSVEMKKSRLR